MQTVKRELGRIFHFYSNFNGTFCKPTEETLIRRCVLRRLILHMSQTKNVIMVVDTETTVTDIIHV